MTFEVYTAPPRAQVQAPNNEAAPPSRSEVMRALISNAFHNPISALEIGVWFGTGSTNIWLDCLQRKSNLVLVDAWRPYASGADLQDKEWDYRRDDSLSTDAFLSTFLNVKKFEEEKKEKEINISIVRGKTDGILPLFSENIFDFIYIDGDHKYKIAKSDIKHAKRLVRKDFGIICGDDLEQLPSPYLLELAQQHKDLDFLRAPHYFHPGMLLAISEEFPEVNMVNGFWWITCVNGKFTTHVLPPNILYP